MGLGQYDGQGMYCGLSTASEVFSYFWIRIRFAVVSEVRVGPSRVNQDTYVS